MILPQHVFYKSPHVSRVCASILRRRTSIKTVSSLASFSLLDASADSEPSAGTRGQQGSLRFYSSMVPLQAPPTFSNTGGINAKKKSKFIPKKAAVAMTEQARTFFVALLEKNPDKAGIMINFDQASSGQPRMVYSFDFVTEEELSPQDEGVSLEVLEDGNPKTPKESLNDGLPKLFVHHNAFLKVLGATVDINMETISLILYDREGNVMDPNA